MSLLMYGNLKLGDCHAAVSGVLPYIKEPFACCFVFVLAFIQWENFKKLTKMKVYKKTSVKINISKSVFVG